MSRRRKYIALALVSFAAVLAVSVIPVLRSAWFREKVRERVIATIEEATGGRAEVGALRFDWRRLRIEVYGLVLHGTEPAGKPPLLRVASVAVGWKIVSLRHYDVDIRYLDLQSPEIYLIVFPDGRTNLPEPKTKPKTGAPLEPLVNLAIGRFRIGSGVFAVESGVKIPFTASGRNLNARFQFEKAARRYRGNIAIQPLELVWQGQKALLRVEMALGLETNRVAIDSARWVLGSSHVSFSGTVDNLASPRISLHYEAAAFLADVRRFTRLAGVERATVEASGEGVYESGGKYSITGTWRATGEGSWSVAAGDRLAVRDLRASGKLRADAQGFSLAGMRLAALASYPGNAIPAEGRIAALTIRGNRAEAHDIALDLLGGAFTGDAYLEGPLEAEARLRVQGEIRGIEARRAVAAYNPRQPLPWNSLLSGSLSVDTSLAHTNDLRAAAQLTLSPVPRETPAWGQVSATYDARAGTLDLGTSILNLPSSLVAVSGSFGRQIKAHLETRNLDDFLPLLGQNTAALPLQLENGSLVFDGTITGRLSDPRIAGRITLNWFSWSGEHIDSFAANLSLASQSASLKDAAVAEGPLRARFEADIGLREWQATDTSSLTGRGTVRNASIAEILARLGRTNIPATGTLNATAEVSGTIGQPHASGQIDIAKGAFQGEPFDQLRANVSYGSLKLEATSGQISAGSKQATFVMVFDHARGNLKSGCVHFDIATNSLPLDQIATLEKLRPGLKGAAQITAKGELAVAAGVRITALNGDVTARGLQLPGTPLRDVHFTAQTETAPNQVPILHTRLDTGFANSSVHGDGEWRLEGDYPGTSSIRFSRLDLADLRDWLAPASTPPPFRGFAEGEIRISGPALKPELIKGELRVESFELGPASGAAFTLHNAGPIVATASNSIVTIENAHLTGPSTDVTVGGRLLVNQKNPLDLKANGRIDLSLVQTLVSGITSSGTATFEAGLRGAPGKPQVDGRLEIANASLSHPGIPNGISKGRGVVVFTGDRATIQSFTGETGGGQIRLTGFAGYTAGRPVFGLQADAAGVRIRYPEGISTVANANLNFTGSGDRSMLTGTISVLRSNVNLQSDFSSLLVKSSEPVRTPSSSTGFLGGLNFDVQIQTSADAQIETSLTQGIQAEASLRLRGTASNPALQGRVNVFQGQVMFFGTKYAISEGSVSFFNPLKVEPVLDIDLETRVRGIDITLTVAGPLDKLTVTPRSDPPLQYNEILSVLATGSYPTDSSLRVQQSALPQGTQPSSASALLGQVISSPVTGRLQRFFGVSGIRIDPTLPGTEYNPQARVTIQQQVTPDVTLTYIANVTQANPQVVSVEWAASKQWSVVAQREENGLIGLDFFFKRRFK